MEPGKVMQVLPQPDGHIVTVYDNGMSCTCGQSTPYTSDFGALRTKYIPCQHIQKIRAEVAHHALTGE
jgi:hypothetical protein